MEFNSGFKGLKVMTLLLPLKTKLSFERSYEQHIFHEISFAHELHRMQAVAYHAACPHRSTSLVNDRMNSKQKKKKNPQNRPTETKWKELQERRYFAIFV